MQITINTNATTEGPFDTDQAYVEWVVAQAVLSWRKQFPGSSGNAAIQAARLAHNAALADESGGAVVPTQVTMRQARLIMLGTPVNGSTMLDMVQASIDAIPDAQQRRAAQITWDYSSVVQRYHGMVPQLAAQLGLTDAQLDALFTAAADL